ncbi:hypothetical protein F3Y22_tig00011662pilonHSYRG00061 [Hibiscus syriacus]|uniref:RNase H type-1 domain-containing protein n=1 Tax=Hibiscus syriacus TaxID=106335 RepID=A0A6A3C3X2_HIBSY|nr:hypothetical protein F3Y22_tig00011662pilonHSYRG00061 [Hibiscus syriacus]
MFVSILWCLWTRRNKFIFDSGFIESESILQRGRRLCEESVRARVVMNGVTRRAACGGVICDSNGSWAMGFEGFWVLFRVDAELWGVYEGLSVTWALDIKAVEVETDNR